jgi:hypothetical protein
MAAAAGCQFSPSGQPGGGRDGGPDATFVTNDADPDQPDANCAWPFQPEHFEPCGPGKPPPLVTPLVLNVPGRYTYNTDTHVLTNPVGIAIASPPQTQENGAEAIWVAGLTIESGSVLRVEGSRPFMIVSTADIVVKGIIDASSSLDPGVQVFDRGAGSDPDNCSTTAPQVGNSCISGGGGGGGGGFNGAGGSGGDGAGDRSCGLATPGSPGGNGGRSQAAPPSRLLGGCDGARGGNGEDGVMQYGLGGAGGGAVHLVSQTRIDIEGIISAGGAAGGGAQNKRSGGGGGGSGGFVGLEALDIEIDADAIIAANGGGGGGGTDRALAPSGEDGKTSSDFAAGGAGVNGGGEGGDGSAGGVDDGQAGVDGQRDRGGGGGGGGAGFIVVYQVDPVITSGATISPPHTRK